MERLIKDGDIILDGTLTRAEKEKQAFQKLEDIEELMDCYSIRDLRTLHRILYLAWALGDIQEREKQCDELQKITEKRRKKECKKSM